MNLTRQGIDSFMPMREATRRRAGRLETRAVPLFPGYLFVELRPDLPNWRAVNSTYGVSKLVGIRGGTPTPLPSALMAALKDRTRNGIWSCTVGEFRADQDVRLIHGPFAGALARIESIPDNERIFVLLDIMGRMTRLDVSPALLEAV
jgi:transcriptional antiterminator RfaH